MSEQLKQIIDENETLTKKEYILPYLAWMESIIPEDARTNFYRNLKTLKINDHLENLELESSLVNDYGTSGGYNSKENLIDMDPSAISYFLKISKETKNPTEFFEREYTELLLHELFHMASSEYNPETQVVKSGFDTFPTADIDKQNRGLTEGMTEVLAMVGVPNTIEIASGYYIEANFINQLSIILNPTILMESYFGNKGTKVLEEKLNGLGFSEEKSYNLFRNIEKNFNQRRNERKQNTLSNIQDALLDYMDKRLKLEILQDNFNRENLENLINQYETSLITKEKLQLTGRNPEIYEDLEKNIQKWNRMKVKYIYLLEEITSTSEKGEHRTIQNGYTSIKILFLTVGILFILFITLCILSKLRVGNITNILIQSCLLGQNPVQ